MLDVVVPDNVDLYTYPHPSLQTPAFDVVDFDDKKELIEQMFQIMYDNDGVGLAAPQVGLPFRLFVFDDRSGFKGHLFNAFIRKSSQRTILHEGCLSLPGLYLNDIRRGRKCTISGFDLNCNRLSYSLDGLAAQIMQHEVDHLEGILFYQRSVNPFQTTRLIEDWKTVMGL